MVVDSSALVAILLGEAGCDALAVKLSEARQPVLCAANWLEAMMVVSVRLGPRGVQALDELLDAVEVRVVAADAELVQTAFAAWQRFGKGRHPAGLNFGDCFAYATAMNRGEALLFKGEDFSQTDVPQA